MTSAHSSRSKQCFFSTVRGSTPIPLVLLDDMTNRFYSPPPRRRFTILVEIANPGVERVRFHFWLYGIEKQNNPSFDGSTESLMKEMPLDLLEESLQEAEENGEGNSDDGIALFGDSDDAFV